MLFSELTEVFFARRSLLIPLVLALLSVPLACRDTGSVEIVLPSSESNSGIVVYVTGEVVNPGLHTLPPGQNRLLNAIEAAGGFTANADQASVNGALIISDQEHISVLPVPGNTPSGNIASGNSPRDNISGTLVDLNAASSEELQTLPGIGPGRAEAIIDHRESHGPFTRIEDILEVSGIGEKTFESIQHLIRVQ